MQDFFGKNADALKDKRLFLFDMDGTIYCGENLFDGVIDLLSIMRDKGVFYAFITNNSSKSLIDYVAKVKRLGIVDVTEESFFSSAQATVMVLKQRFGDGLIYAQGTRSFISELTSGGINLTTQYTTKAVAVVVGFDTELTGEKLATTSKMLCLNKDIPFYATNPDLCCPTEFGAVPDCGSMCIGLKNATGRTPIYIGKPQPTMIDVVVEKFGVTKEQTVVVGDRLYTDIASGVNAGVDTVLVLSGESTVEDLKASTVKPTYVFKSVADFSL